MATILVTGGTGFIGSRLVKRLVNDGHTVRAMAISNDPLLGNLNGVDCEIVTGDITKPESLTDPVTGVDIVFHLAAVLYSDRPELFESINYNGTKALVDQSVAAGVTHFVYVSAAAANYEKRTLYGRTKHRAELLMESPQDRTNFTIARPTLVFGPNGGGQELIMYVEKLLSFRWFVPIVGDGSARKRWVHVDDVINGCALLADKPVSYGKTYNFGGGGSYTMREYTEMLCAKMGIDKLIVGIPVWMCRGLAAILNVIQDKPMLKADTILGVTMDADFEIESARREIGYDPVDFKDWIGSEMVDDPFWERGTR